MSTPEERERARQFIDASECDPPHGCMLSGTGERCVAHVRPHINNSGQFQSDKYPSTPAGKVPLSVTDPTAQDLLWEYAQRRRAVDAEFADDLEYALNAAGYRPVPTETDDERAQRNAKLLQQLSAVTKPAPPERLPVCAVAGCTNEADPRMYSHNRATEDMVMVCDGHGMGGDCRAPEDPCTCPPIDPTKDTGRLGGLAQRAR